MEEELNYLSERIEKVDENIDRINRKLKLFPSEAKDAIKNYKKYLSIAEKEKEILSNILSVLTLVEMEKQGINKRADDLDENINWE